jgi:hypothetical protein
MLRVNASRHRGNMSIIERITPGLARTVFFVAVVTVIAAVTASVLLAEPRIASFAGFAYLSGAYARKVLKAGASSDAVSAPATVEQRIQRLAA